MTQEVLENLIQKSGAVAEPGDYQRDGLLYCGTCGTPKQCRIQLGGSVRVVGCLCQCANRRLEEERENWKLEEERLKIDALRVSGIADTSLRGCRFETAQESPVIANCRLYVQRWENVRENNLGILLWGETGGGKTYAAACVANALIDRGVPALITSFPRILAASYSEREDLLYKISRFPLLVLDDFGAERGTNAALETVYTVIDERYKAKKPTIATTNLTMAELHDPKDLAHRRIYERILEMCTPVFVDGSSYRKDAGARKLEIMKEILGG